MENMWLGKLFPGQGKKGQVKRKAVYILDLVFVPWEKQLGEVIESEKFRCEWFICYLFICSQISAFDAVGVGLCLFIVKPHSLELGRLAESPKCMNWLFLRAVLRPQERQLMEFPCWHSLWKMAVWNPLLQKALQEKKWKKVFST